MPRSAVAGRTSALITAARGPSIYSNSGSRPHIREIGLFNTTTTALAVAVVRASTTGTRGATLTKICESDDSYTPITDGYNTHTVDATVGGPLRQASLGAAVGSGIIWTFGADGLVIPGAGTGIVIILPTGTAQHLDFYISWDE